MKSMQKKPKSSRKQFNLMKTQLSLNAQILNPPNKFKMKNVRAAQTWRSSPLWRRKLLSNWRSTINLQNGTAMIFKTISILFVWRYMKTLSKTEFIPCKSHLIKSAKRVMVSRSILRSALTLILKSHSSTQVSCRWSKLTWSIRCHKAVLLRRNSRLRSTRKN